MTEPLQVFWKAATSSVVGARSRICSEDGSPAAASLMVCSAQTPERFADTGAVIPAKSSGTVTGWSPF